MEITIDPTKPTQLDLLERAGTTTNMEVTPNSDGTMTVRVPDVEAHHTDL